MASTLAISSTDKFLALLVKRFPYVFPKPVGSTDGPKSTLKLPSGAEIDGSNTIATHFAQNLFPGYNYSSIERAEITQWLSLSSEIADADTTASTEPSKSSDSLLNTLNEHLSTRTTVLGSKPSLADIAVYARISSLLGSWSAERKTGKDGLRHVVRHIDFVQHAPLFNLELGKEAIPIDLDDLKYKETLPEPAPKKVKPDAAAAAAAAAAASGTAQAEPTSKTETVKQKVIAAKDSAKEKVVAAAAAVKGPGGEKKEKQKKEKQPKPQKQAEPVKILPSQIDLRVGHILKAIQHPNADSLFVSTIACGDEPGSDVATVQPEGSEFAGQVTRTVCSGLNGLIPLEEMQGRKVIVVCNLKPVTMRGVKSAAMVLAASPRPTGDEKEDHGHGGPVELVSPPADAKAGEPVYFEGYEGKAEGVLNPKKKIWETIQPGFTTTDDLKVKFDHSLAPTVSESADKEKSSGLLTTKSGGVCVVHSLKGATVR
jgi:aminoacyl tRNA synthase complex-interacting multifunctional protein 1